jgi:threonine/homoserine/homoserine lactone efflux protein
MSLHMWFGFAAAAMIVLIAPGPTLILVTSKGIAFCVAFLTQFVDPGSETFPQPMLLGTTFLGPAAVDAAYGFFAGQLRDMLQNATARRWFHCTGATALIAAGIVTATPQRSS